MLEAHFGVGVMDFETLAYARQHGIHPLAFASLSQRGTDLPACAARGLETEPPEPARTRPNPPEIARNRPKPPKTSCTPT